MQATADAVNIAENISILHFLHEVVEKPSNNEITPPKGHRPTEYSLPFEKERDLTMILAYISCIKSNPNRVPALCIRENKAANELDILLAVNAISADQNGVLLETQAKFQKLFKLLRSVPTSDNAEADIFAEIVSMCTTRILERLRLVRKNGKYGMRPRPLMKDHLLDARQILSQRSPAFADGARDLVHKIDLWTKHEATPELARVVESAHNLSQLSDLEELLIGPTSKEEMIRQPGKCLLDFIRKVARYRIAARVLYRAAKKFDIARKMNFVPVNLPRAAFRKVPEEEQARRQDINEALSRTTLSNSERSKIEPCFKHLKMNQANQRFRRQKIKTLKEAKIHAEVQIVFFCEEKNFQPPPRVISSSKDACFLCNELIKLQRKYHIPRRHGKLYPGWRLPWPTASNSLQSQFAKHLEKLVAGSIKQMIASKSRVKYPDPNESTALTVTASETTIISTGRDIHSVSSNSNNKAKAKSSQQTPPQSPGDAGPAAAPLVTPCSLSIANVAKVQGEAMPKPQDSVNQGGGGVKGNSVSLGKPEEVADQGGEKGESALAGRPQEVADQGGEGGRSAVPPGKPPKVPPRPPPKERPRVFSEQWAKLSNPAPNRLIQGTSQVVNVKANTSSKFYKGSSVRLEIEYCTTGPAEKRVAHDLSCNLEWLTTIDAEAIRADRNALVINTEDLKAEIQIPSSALEKWYIATKETMIRVQIR
ncbi:unnamed protein product [Clonostachys rosea]|uniref:Uncharacterized protein n=1 Tax=Bionectria ochroleuca TaxID=29856 RepID=A0ABY6UDK3_BIOOC|nr:unnamed protein product [Clonostachys rosea]